MRTDRHVGQVIRHQVGTEHVAFLHRGPKFAGGRVPGHAVGIAQACGELSLVTAGEIDFPDGGAPLFLLVAVFGDVRGRTYRDEQVFAVLAQGEIAHPVIAARWQGHQLFGLAPQPGRAWLEIERQHGIVIGHEEFARAERHARG